MNKPVSGSPEFAAQTMIGFQESITDQIEGSLEIMPGDRLEKFEIIRKLGQGGMGAVFLARDSTLDRQVAIKMLNASIAQDQAALQRFLAEGRAAGKLNHPHVVSVFDIVQRKTGDYFIVMEYLPNGSVADLLLNRNPIDAVQSTRLLLEATRGIAAAHRAGLTHRDIKPANLMLGENRQVKVADFGLAKSHQVDDARMTQAGQILGTPYFMSPEQCLGQEVDSRSDLYSLGATYYTLLAGISPFENSGSTLEVIVAHVNHDIPEIRTLRPDTPGLCSRIIYRAMQKRPEDRYQTAEEMVADLEAILPVLLDPAARQTVSYRGRAHNRMESFQLPSEKLRPALPKSDSGPSWSSVTPMIARWTGKPKSDISTVNKIQTQKVATEFTAEKSGHLPENQTLNSASDPADNRPSTETNYSQRHRDVYTVPSGRVTFSWPKELQPADVPEIESWLKLIVEKLKRVSQTPSNPQATESPAASSGQT